MHIYMSKSDINAHLPQRFLKWYFLAFWFLNNSNMKRYLTIQVVLCLFYNLILDKNLLLYLSTQLLSNSICFLSHDSWTIKNKLRTMCIHYLLVDASAFLSFIFFGIPPDILYKCFQYISWKQNDYERKLQSISKWLL